MHKRISILGSTGSIGKSTLQVVRHLKGAIEVSALAAKSNIDLLELQAHEFHPTLIAVYEEKKALELQKRLPHIRVVTGEEGLKEVAALDGVDCVVSALSGSIGISPTLAAIEAKKTVALANKEVLVAAGEYVMERARVNGVSILPVDSEHSALFQCLEGKEPSEVRRLIVTASGGPFLHHSPEQLEQVTLAQALAHPNWSMGPKITVDSSTLMNKGLEVIEAHFLFQMPVEKIDVVFHPQSLIHSMVEMRDGSILAQMSEPNMILPIQYALTYPKREEGILAPFDFQRFSRLDFFPARPSRFLCLDLAFEALHLGGNAPCYLNAANEVLVEQFIQGKIRWIDIPHKLERLFHRFQSQKGVNLEQILATDQMAREQAIKE